MSQKYKKMIPNILTVIRLIAAPLVIILAALKLYLAAFIILIIACITDFFDGKLARKWNVVSSMGAKLDCIADKVLSISMIIFLTLKFKMYAIILIFECIIGIYNIIVYLKTDHVESLFIGKIKTTVIFFTMIFGFLYFVNNNLKDVLIGLIYMSANLQLLTLISYIFHYYDKLKNEELEKELDEDKNKRRKEIFDVEDYDDFNDSDLDETIEIVNIKDI